MPTSTIEMRVEVHTKPGCALCERALALLEAARARFCLTIVELDVREDAARWAAERYLLPVVLIDGIPRLTLQFTAQQLEDALALALEESSHRA